MSEAIEILKSCDAFLEGHFLLSSGRHSSAYCQMAFLQQYPDRCAEVMAPVAAKIKGTLVNQVLHNDNPPELVRIGHPAGVIPCYSEVDENNNVKKAAIVRTARRLMEGYALLEKAKYQD